MSSKIVSPGGLKSLPAAEREGLTERQAAFVAAVVSGHTIHQAVVVAGYVGVNISFFAKQLAAEDKIQYAIRRAMRRKLQTEAVPTSINYMMDLVRDETASHRDRLTAAKTLADMAGFGASGEGAAAGAAKSPSEMTQDELRAFLADTERELARRATDMGAAKGADSAAPEPQTPDFIE